MTRRTELTTGRRQTGDPNLDEVWRKLDAIITVINASPLASGRLITEEDDAISGSGLAFVAAVARSIPHRLGRTARGFVEVYSVNRFYPSVAHVGLFPTAHPDGKTSDTHVTVTPTATGTSWLLVF